MDKQIANLPSCPGVYIFKDKKGVVIYVGKAANLKQRAKSYFSSSSSLPLKTKYLVLRIQNLEYIVTNSEQEALILECTLIKKYHPRYNARLKDDKTFPYLKVTINEEWPTIYVTRNTEEAEARYFGPFANAGSVRKTLKMIKKIFLFRSCSKYINGKSKRPCLEYYIHQCLGPCIGAINKEEYREVINQVVLFLEGKQDLVLKMLYEKMKIAIELLEFEKAASIRDQIKAATKVIEGQQISIRLKGEQDVIALKQNEEQAYVELFFIRDSKLIGHDHFIMDGIQDETSTEIMTSFVKQYYNSTSYVPSSILLQYPVDDKSILVDWLKQRKGSRVNIQVPQRGVKKQLVAMVERNAANGLLLLKKPTREITRIGLLELKDKLKLPGMPFLIECYDISTIQGIYAVGSMVILEEGLPKPSRYRRFRIKANSGQNDYAMMKEVLIRRMARAINNTQGKNLNDMDKNKVFSKKSEVYSSWGELPDLILVDGGKGQLNTALAVLRDMGVSVPLASLAKENEDVFIPNRSTPVNFVKDSIALRILQKARDEAHRFAVNYHRNVRQKESISSILEDIPGIGPKRRRSLLKKFGSIAAIKEASITEICQIDSMNANLAKKIKEYC